MIRRYSLSRSQTGLSLVELMVGLALGLVLMVGVLQVFLASRQTYASNDAMSRLQENGRFALEFIASSARLAGYTDPRARLEKGLSTASLAGSNCDNQKGFVGTDTAVCSSNGNGNASDSLGIALQPPLVDGIRRDCLGNDVPDDKVIINHFEIIPPDNVNNTPAALGCRAWNVTDGAWVGGVAAAQPLVEGIDSLQVLYGIDDSGGTSRSPSRYVSADTVTAGNDWPNVLAIRIALLANSVATLTPAPQNRNYVLLDAAPLAAADLGNDNRARQIFSTTIHLKNAN